MMISHHGMKKIGGRLATTTTRRSKTIIFLPPTTPPRYLSTTTATTTTSASAATDTDQQQQQQQHPTLQHIPSLPFLGSFISSYSGIPQFNFEKAYDFHIDIRQKYGNFYTMGIPGLGSGVHGTVYVTIDPNEMMKVIRSEGAHPSGTLESHWMIRRMLKEHQSPLVSGNDYGLWDRGERWKKQRTFLQTGMLDPKSAKGFVPCIVDAASMASKAAYLHSKDVNTYLNYCAIDMFFSFMFGELLGMASKDPSKVVSTDDDDDDDDDKDETVVFCKAATDFFCHFTELISDPTENIRSEVLGMKSVKYQLMEECFQTLRTTGRSKIVRFMERYESGKEDMTDAERASYLANAIERLKKEEDPEKGGGGGISTEEMIELCMVALFAAVDTTSNLTAWNMVHLALNPHVQERLHEELITALGNKTHVDVDVFSKSSSPYLHRVLRESLRVTPPFSMAQLKSNQRSEVEMHGITLPKGSKAFLAHIGRDSNFVEGNPMTFDPDRWTDENVTKRKGTNGELLDHPMLRDPFMQGARRCPASRVATNEILALLSCLVLDWKIGIKDSENVKTLDDIKYGNAIIRPTIPELTFEARQGRK